MSTSMEKHARGIIGVATVAAVGLVACSQNDQSGQNDQDTGETGSAGESQQLSVLSVSDFHGTLTSGYEFACTIEHQREEDGANILVTAGDDVGASGFESAIQDDQPTLDFYNALQIDAAALGNHEFDQGYDDVVERLDPETDYELLGANVFMQDSDERAATPYATFEEDGLNVAVIGAVTDETPELVTPEGISDIEFRDPIDSINTVIEEELEEEPDVIIASFHDGSAQELEVGEVPDDSWSQRLQDELSDEVDAVINAHTHNVYAYTAENFPVIQPGANAENLGRIVLEVDTATGEVTAEEPELIPMSERDPEDCAGMERFDAAAEIVDEAEEYAEEIGGEVLTTQEGDLTTAWSADVAEYEQGQWSAEEGAGSGDLRSAQSSMGSLVADFHQDTTAWPEGTSPDIGLINAGGLRDDIRGEGEVTLRDAVNVVPFNNRLMSLEMTGETLQNVLEQQWAEGDYHQLGVSSNFRYTYDSDADEGQRITSMWLEGEPIADDDLITVGVGEFLAEGGDGFTAFTESEEVNATEVLDTEVWPEYLESLDTIAPDYALRGVEIQGLTAGEELSTGEQVEFSVGSMHSLSLGAPEVSTLTITLVQDDDEYPLQEADYELDGEDGGLEASVEIPAEVSAGEASLEISADEGDTVAELPVTVTQ